MATTRRTTPKPAVAPETVHLDLAAEVEVEREANPIEPFTVLVGDRVITMQDARDLDWEELYDLDHPAALVEHTIPKADWAYFLAQKLPGRAINILFERYREHYGIRKPAGRR